MSKITEKHRKKKKQTEIDKRMEKREKKKKNQTEVDKRFYSIQKEIEDLMSYIYDLMMAQIKCYL